jgi:hypothetical protein
LIRYAASVIGTSTLRQFLLEHFRQTKLRNRVIATRLDPFGSRRILCISHAYEASMNQNGSLICCSSWRSLAIAFNTTVLGSPARDVTLQSYQQTSFPHSGQVGYLVPSLWG